jgi:hypothetical protein
LCPENRDHEARTANVTRKFLDRTGPTSFQSQTIRSMVHSASGGFETTMAAEVAGMVT